jgi:predicted TPR repeat methyltransferase
VLVGERSPGDAVPLARQAAILAPGEPRYAFTLGYYQARAGDLASATATLEALLAAQPGHRDAAALLAEVRARSAPGPAKPGGQTGVSR